MTFMTFAPHLLLKASGAVANMPHNATCFQAFSVAMRPQSAGGLRLARLNPSPTVPADRSAGGAASEDTAAGHGHPVARHDGHFSDVPHRDKSSYQMRQQRSSVTIWKRRGHSAQRVHWKSIRNHA